MDCNPPGSSVMGFSRQEYWSGLPFPPPGDLPDPGIKLTSAMSPALVGGIFTAMPPGNPIRSLGKGRLLSSFQQNVDFTNPGTKFDDAYSKHPKIDY